MANKYKGEVEIRLDGGERYVICFPVNSIVELEDKTGKDFITLTRELSTGVFSVKLIRQILWAGLIAHQPKITETEAGVIMNDFSLNETLAKINESFEKAFPSTDGEVGDAGANPPPKNGNGKASVSHS